MWLIDENKRYTLRPATVEIAVPKAFVTVYLIYCSSRQARFYLCVFKLLAFRPVSEGDIRVFPPITPRTGIRFEITLRGLLGSSPRHLNNNGGVQSSGAGCSVVSEIGIEIVSKRDGLTARDQIALSLTPRYRADGKKLWIFYTCYEHLSLSLGTFKENLLVKLVYYTFL